MNDNKEKQIKCQNVKCRENKNGECSLLTNNDILNKRIHCEERIWSGYSVKNK